jgi:hypothetical protein
MTQVGLAHQALADFCLDNPGIGIGKELITFLIRGAIDRINQATQTIKYPTTTDFYGMQVSYSGRADATGLSVQLLADPAPGGIDPAVPILLIQKISFSLDVYLSATLMSTHVVSYDLIRAKFAVTGHKISLVCNTSIGKWGSPTNNWNNMKKLPDGTDFIQAKKDEWNVVEKAFELLTKDEFGRSFVSSIEIPNILGMVESFTFTGPISTSGTDELVMFTGLAEWAIDCPRRPTGAIATSLLQVRADSAHENAEETSVNGDDGDASEIAEPIEGEGEGEDEGEAMEADALTEFDHLNAELVANPEGVNGEYPPGMGSGGHSESGDVFVYLPRVFVEHRFDGIIKPSATFSDAGSVGPIFWHYEGAIAPAPHAQLQISLEHFWPLEFKISLPLQAFGSAGAGVKIGCITYEAAGFAFNGLIDTFEVYFKAGLDILQEEIYFESRLGNIHSKPFQFNHWPQIEFPLDQIADLLLGYAAQALINGQAGRTLNVTRFSLVGFGLFRGFGQMVNALAAAGDRDRVTVGAVFHK